MATVYAKIEGEAPRELRTARTVGEARGVLNAPANSKAYLNGVKVPDIRNLLDGDGLVFRKGNGYKPKAKRRGQLFTVVVEVAGSNASLVSITPGVR